MDQKLIEEKIKLAEASVSSVVDKSLKEKAFEVVLSSLLQQTESVRGITPTADKVKLKKNKPKNVNKLQTTIPRSELKFDETQLKELKNYYDKYKPAGSEVCIFILASFLHNNLGIEKFHDNDIKYCYDQLLAVRTITRPQSLNLIQIKRALSWLISPTRRKLWLETDIDGLYKISANGVLKLRDMENELEAINLKTKAE